MSDCDYEYEKPPAEKIVDYIIKTIEDSILGLGPETQKLIMWNVGCSLLVEIIEGTEKESKQDALDAAIEMILRNLTEPMT